jgi:DNA uptake protein ComE-like DNA-binding protein
LRRFFYIHRSDRRVIITLLCIVVVVLTAIVLTGGDETATDSSAIDKKRHAQRRHYDNRPIDEGGPTRQVRLFPFDPNTADSTQLLQLGLQRWQVRNIYRYRRAGGIYRRPQDFARLYGLTAGQYRQLEPYIRISADYQPASRLVEPEKPYVRDTLRYPVKIEQGQHVVLNTADTAQLRRVPGIGTYFANEIVNHGRFLGGYVSVDQLDEIPDFPQEAKQYFVISSPNPRRLNVNRLSLNELKRHPYINYYQAKAIVDYRRLHGRIENLRQLSLSKDFPPDAIRRLEPYIEY